MLDPTPSYIYLTDTAIILSALRSKMRMVVHFLPLVSCEVVLMQPSCCESKKCTPILIFKLRALNIMAVPTEVAHEGIGTSPNSHCHGHTSPLPTLIRRGTHTIAYRHETGENLCELAINCGHVQATSTQSGA